MKVLVVDDDEGVRSSTCEILEMAGYETESAEDGDQALQKVGPDVDAMVLDLYMPHTDGVAVLDALADEPVVIVLSAFEYRDRDELEALYGERICAFLHKPVSPRVLLETVDDCLRRSA